MEFTRYLRRVRHKVNEILFESIPADGFISTRLWPLLEEQNVPINELSQTRHLHVQLTQPWSEFLQTMSKNRRSHIRRALRKLEPGKRRLFRVQDIRQESDIGPLFDELVKLHQRRWNRLGLLGSFAGKNNILFQKTVAVLFFRRGWLQMRRLTASDQPEKSLAIDMNYQYKERVYGLYCAVDDLSPHFNSGPGSVLLYDTLRRTAESDLHTYDFLRGEESYKSAVSNDQTITKTIRIQSPVYMNTRRSKLAKKWLHRKRQWIRKRTQLRIFLKTHQLPQGLLQFAGWQFSRLRERIK